MFSSHMVVSRPRRIVDLAATEWMYLERLVRVQPRGRRELRRTGEFGDVDVVRFGHEAFDDRFFRLFLRDVRLVFRRASLRARILLLLGLRMGFLRRACLREVR